MIYTMSDITNEIRRIAGKLENKEKLTPSDNTFAKNILLEYATTLDNRANSNLGKIRNDDEYHRLHREKTLSERIEKRLKRLREEPVN